MTVTDWRCWLLTRMEFSNENMATLMNVRIDSVYKQKKTNQCRNLKIAVICPDIYSFCIVKY